jgi:hypothetical protein
MNKFLKTFHPSGIRARDFCSVGGLCQGSPIQVSSKLITITVKKSAHKVCNTSAILIYIKLPKVSNYPIGKIRQIWSPRTQVTTKEIAKQQLRSNTAKSEFHHFCKTCRKKLEPY